MKMAYLSTSKIETHAIIKWIYQEYISQNLVMIW
jgi:hypothetical protein